MPLRPVADIVRGAPLSELAPFIIACLDEGKSVTVSVRGNSMRPLLTDRRDAVTFNNPPARLKKGDVPLHVRDNGKYIMHRVIKVTGDTYSLRGDAQEIIEENIRHDQIIALAASFERKGKNVNVSNPLYRLYSFFWTNSRLCRRIGRRLHGVLS
jgi:signal peptidase I